MKIRPIAQIKLLIMIEQKKRKWCERERERTKNVRRHYGNTIKNALNQLIARIIILKLSIDACESHARTHFNYSAMLCEYITFADSIIMCVYDVINTPITLQMERFCRDFFHSFNSSTFHAIASFAPLLPPRRVYFAYENGSWNTYE